MDLKLPNLAELVPERLMRSRLLQPRYPMVALELRTDGITALQLQKTKGRISLAAHVERPLPDGVMGSTLFQTTLDDASRLEAEVRGAIEGLGARSVSKVSLGIPDSLAKVALIDLPEIPRRAAQAREMILWKVRRTLPFRAEEAVICYRPVSSEGDDYRVLATVAHAKTVRHLESMFQAMGIRVGLVDLASFNLYNALRPAIAASAPAGSDVAVLNATEGYFTLMIFRGDRPLFVRCKTYHVGGGFQGAESLRVVQREVRSSLSYYVEKLGGPGVARTYLRAVGVDVVALTEFLSETELGEVHRADVPPKVDGFDGLDRNATDALLPALGLALGRAA